MLCVKICNPHLDLLTLNEVLNTLCVEHLGSITNNLFGWTKPPYPTFYNNYYYLSICVLPCLHHGKTWEAIQHCHDESLSMFGGLAMIPRHQSLRRYLAWVIKQPELEYIKLYLKFLWATNKHKTNPRIACWSAQGIQYPTYCSINSITERPKCPLCTLYKVCTHSCWVSNNKASTSTFGSSLVSSD